MQCISRRVKCMWGGGMSTRTEEQRRAAAHIIGAMCALGETIAQHAPHASRFDSMIFEYLLKVLNAMVVKLDYAWRNEPGYERLDAGEGVTP